MGKRKWLLLVLVTIFFTVTGFAGRNSKNASDFRSIIDYAEAAAIKIDLIDICYWTELMPLRQSKQAETVSYVCKLLEAELESLEINDNNIAIGIGSIGNVRLQVKAAEDELFVFIHQQGNVRQITDLYEFIEQRLHDINRQSGILSAAVSGKLPMPVNTEEARKIAQSIMKYAEANEFDICTDNTTITSSAYSGLLRNYIEIEEEKINLDLAVTGGNRLWLGTPVIPSGY